MTDTVQKRICPKCGSEMIAKDWHKLSNEIERIPLPIGLLTDYFWFCEKCHHWIPCLRSDVEKPIEPDKWIVTKLHIDSCEGDAEKRRARIFDAEDGGLCGHEEKVGEKPNTLLQKWVDDSKDEPDHDSEEDSSAEGR